MKASDKNVLFIEVELYSNKKVNSFLWLVFPIATTYVYYIIWKMGPFIVIVPGKYIDCFEKIYDICILSLENVCYRNS